MDSASSGSGKSWRGVVVVAAVALIGAAWIFATFGGGLASAAGSAKERVDLMLMSDEEEIDRAVQEFARTFNYEGSDGGEYRAQREEVVTEDYWSSPHGESAREFAALLDDSEDVYANETKVAGTRTVRRGEDYRVLEVTYEGRVTWGGEVLLDGQARSEVRVVRRDGRWSVGWASNSRQLEKDGS